MIVSINWLQNHQHHQNLVILDTRPKSMFLYGHLPNSQNLTVEQVIKFDKFGSNLVENEEKISSTFSFLGIDDSKQVLVVGDSMDPSSARVAWTLLYYGHEKTLLLDANISELNSRGFNFIKNFFSSKKHIPTQKKTRK